jgi:hypothetical protein
MLVHFGVTNRAKRDGATGGRSEKHTFIFVRFVEHHPSGTWKLALPDWLWYTKEHLELFSPITIALFLACLISPHCICLHFASLMAGLDVRLANITQDDAENVLDFILEENFNGVLRKHTLLDESSTIYDASGETRTIVFWQHYVDNFTKIMEYVLGEN